MRRMIFAQLCLAIWAILLAGCQSVSIDDKEVLGAGEPKTERRVSPSSSDFSSVTSTVYSPSRGVSTLLAKADTQLSKGELDRASASAERAIRLAPKSPKGYLMVAKIRLERQDWKAAEQFSKKALRYASKDENPTLRRAEAWSIIEEARRNRGDDEGAQAAKEHVERYES